MSISIDPKALWKALRPVIEEEAVGFLDLAKEEIRLLSRDAAKAVAELAAEMPKMSRRRMEAALGHLEAQIDLIAAKRHLQIRKQAKAKLKKLVGIIGKTAISVLLRL